MALQHLQIWPILVEIKFSGLPGPMCLLRLSLRRNLRLLSFVSERFCVCVVQACVGGVLREVEEEQPVARGGVLGSSRLVLPFIMRMAAAAATDREAQLVTAAGWVAPARQLSVYRGNAQPVAVDTAGRLAFGVTFSQLTGWLLTSIVTDFHFSGWVPSVAAANKRQHCSEQIIFV